MKRAGTVPKYRCKRHRGKKLATVRINGRDHYLGPYNSPESRSEYDRLIVEYLASGRSDLYGLVSQESEFTVAELVAEYGQWAKSFYVRKDGSPTATHRNMKPLMKRLLRLFGNLSVQEFRPLQLRTLIDVMCEAQLSQTTIRDAVGRVKHMMKWAASREIIQAEQYFALKTVSCERAGRSTDPVEAVPDEFVDLTLPFLPTMVADMVRLQRATGMRPQEVCAIKPIEIEFQEDVWVYRPTHHKTAHKGKSRAIVLGRSAQRILTPYLGEPNAFCFSARESISRHRKHRSQLRIVSLNCGTRPRPGAQNHGGDCYNSCSYRRAIQRACQRIFFGKFGYKWSPNQLRHAAAEEIQRAGGIEAVVAQLGHSDSKTARRYAKQNLDLAIRTIAKIG